MFEQLDQFDAPVSSDVLLKWMVESQIHAEDVERFCRFHPEHYLRNLMHVGPAYHALVICWKAGQRSPIHDHVGTSCAVKILRGSATETRFDRAPNGMIYATDSRVLETGEICASYDSDIHQISNLQDSDASLITLHLYSPPLLSMNVYSLLDPGVTKFLDPINDEFVEGAGI